MPTTRRQWKQWIDQSSNRTHHSALISRKARNKPRWQSLHRPCIHSCQAFHVLQWDPFLSKLHPMVSIAMAVSRIHFRAECPSKDMTEPDQKHWIRNQLVTSFITDILNLERVCNKCIWSKKILLHHQPNSHKTILIDILEDECDLTMQILPLNFENYVLYKYGEPSSKLGIEYHFLP